MEEIQDFSPKEDSKEEKDFLPDKINNENIIVGG